MYKLKLRRSINLHFILLSFFLIINSLYYFLRFQFPFDSLVLLSYGFLQLVIYVYAFLHLINVFKIYKKLSIIDFLVLLLTFQSIYLLFFTFARVPSIDSILYSLKDYIFPIIFFWYLRSKIQFYEWLKIFKVLAIILSFASFIYLYEFYIRIILGGEPLIYSEKIRELTMLKTGTSELSGTSVFSDGLNLIRFEGVFAHNNASGLAMALGAIISFLIGNHFKSKLFYLFFLINLLALTVSAARTAIFSVMLASIFLYFYRHKEKKPFFLITTPKIKKYFFIFPLIILFLWYLIFQSPFSFLFDMDRIINTIFKIFGNDEVDLFLKFLLNPLLIFGVGYPVPNDFSTTFNVIRSDDLYFIQLITIYGLPGIVILFLLMKNVMRSLTDVKSRNNQTLVFFISIAILSTCLFSTIHTGAFGRPQIFPIVFLALASFSAYFNKIKS